MANDAMFNSVAAYLDKLSDSDDDDFEIPTSGGTPNDPPSSSSATSVLQTPSFPVKDESKHQIIIMNLREPFGDETIREVADSCTIKQILWAIDAGDFVNEIQKISRIGPYDQSGNARPIIVYFKSEEAQKAAIENAEKVKKVQEWKDISIKLYQPLDSKSASQIYDPEKEEMKQRMDAMQKQMEQMAALVQTLQQKTMVPNTNENTQNAAFNQENMQTLLPSVEQPQMQNSDLQAHSSQKMPQYPMNNEVSQTNDGNMAATPQISSQSSANSPPQMPQHQNMPNLCPPFLNQQGQPYSPTEMAEMFKIFMQLQNNANIPPKTKAKVETSSSEESDEEEEESEEEEEEDETSEEESESEGEEDLTVILNKENQLFKSQAERHVGSKKTLNILVLGETGVGKSTWINGIANYLSFDTLEDAIHARRPICLIASKFDFYETNEDRIEVKLEPSHGAKDENEAFSDEGQSSTQEPKTYQFETSKYIVNIIDTPGIGDTRGPDQDKENTRKILNALGQYKDLHAICFLFKANEARMTMSFRYCISELLMQLHKDAVENIIFFFTNARGTFYKPGDTMTPLSSFLEELRKDRGMKISLNSDKICCTDNEAFRLVCAYNSGARFSDEDFLNFAGSWKQSAAETHRFLEFAARSKPHRVEDTVSINKARTIILHLAKPLADVNELIVSNIKVFDDRKKDLHNTANNLDDLKKKSKISQIGIEVKPLNYPKTVCASATCIETSPLPNTEQYQTIYKQICHAHCYLTGVEVEKVPEPHLVNCAAMRGQQNCQVCECHWQSHMHIRFDQIKTTIEIEDKNAKDLIKQNEDVAKVKEKMIKDCEEIIKDYKAEQQKIIDVSLRFGSFLQKNAILPYNDAFEKYVEQTISEEEKCTEVGGDRTKLENLQKLLKQYKQEKALLKEAAKNPTFGGENRITPDEIDDLKVQLFGLKHSGKTLENLFKATEDGIALNNKHVTVRYNPAAQRPVHPYQPPAYPRPGNNSTYRNSNASNSATNSNKKEVQNKPKKNEDQKWKNNKQSNNEKHTKKNKGNGKKHKKN